MKVLILILLFTLIILFVATYFSRKNKKEEIEIKINENSECCGAHEICERDNLLIKDTKVEYFDDEELDELSGVAPGNFTREQLNAISEIFYSLPEDNVAAWLRSLQLRNIQLPDSIREQALMIVGERRS